ncbi:MAG: 4-hydroxythreonine-4-phosphate dehydrogenase PdxA [Methyloceanibacter sp.]
MATVERTERPLVLTIGDPAGIGPDIALYAFAARKREQVPAFVLIGDPAVLAARARTLGLDVTIAELAGIAEGPGRFAHALPLLPIEGPGEVVAGRPDRAAATLITASIERAVALVLEGAASAVVTNPIAKSVLYGAGFAFPGHTEYLAALAAPKGQPLHPVMMLVSPALKAVPVTIHVPLKEVPRLLTRPLIVKTIAITAEGLDRYFGIKHPRLAVSGLNPHAGEEGSMGSEEVDIIAPAIEEARALGIEASGPYPADTMFHEAARAAYDAAICMYHDQALAPFKTLAFEEGVNATLGLPFIRTSPDHGTAFALAGTGKARPRSLIEALRLAAAMSARAGARA